jgi:hypothetical protein
MKYSKISFIFLTLIALFCLMLFTPSISKAQSRDYLTDPEIELVRDANEIDKRIDVLVKAIDRRFLVINNDTSQTKQVTKDSDKWGELPTGTKLELLSDISKILQKAIDDIEDLVARKAMNEKLLESNNDNENETDINTKRVIKTNDKKFPTAVHNLADASRKYLPMLENLEANSKNEKEKGALLRSIEACNSIIEASTQVQKPETTKKKKSKD